MKLFSKPLTAALAVAAAAILIPAVALASTSRSGAPRQAAVIAPACVNAHAALPGGAFVWATSPGDGFAGGVVYAMEITNVGHTACSLHGAPGVGVRNASGKLIGGELPPSGKGALVTLKPGATAWFSLSIYVAPRCSKPVGGQVVVYLPGQKQYQEGWLGAEACAGLRGGGMLQPGTIKAGTGIPFYDV